MSRHKDALPDDRAAFNRETGERIAAARVAAGLTQEQIGARLGNSRALVSLIETGRAGVSAWQLQRIAAACRTTAASLMGEQDTVPAASMLGARMELARVSGIVEQLRAAVDDATRYLGNAETPQDV